MDQLSTLPITNIAILVLAGIGALYLIFKVGSKIIKTVGLILILALGIFFWQGGTMDELKLKGIGTLFGDTPISQFEDKYCAAEKEDRSMCDCVARPIYQDLKSRYSSGELSALDLDKKGRKEAIKESMKNKQAEILSCLKDRGIDNVKELAESFRDTE